MRRSQFVSNGAGMEVGNLDLGVVGWIALRAVFKLSPAARHALLFRHRATAALLQKCLTRLLGGSHPAQSRFTEGAMRGLSFACYTSEKYFLMGTHVEESVQATIQRHLGAGSIAYDIGGHAGYMTLLLSILVGSAGRVFTFEPSAINFTRLCENIEANHRSNITPIRAAVSDRAGHAVLKECGSMSTIVLGGRCVPASSEVEIIRLDDLVYQGGHPAPAFVKLDIEGHAGAALDGMRRILRTSRPIILCELHNQEEEGTSGSILSECGYGMRPVEDERGFPMQIVASSR